MPSEKRDQSVDQLLRRTLASDDGSAAADACLDADTFAAWFDGGLTGDALERVETHAASCARCRAILSAMARTEAAAPAATPERAGLRWLAWAAPLTAAAAAVVLWIVVPSQRTPAVLPAPASLEAPAPAPAPAEAPPVVATDAQRQAALDAAPKTEPRRDQPPARANETIAGFAAAPVVVSSPDAAIRWRLTGTFVERSTDGGATWSTALDTAGQALTAASAPSRTTCWVVGRGGTVLLATDGTTFVRVPFPETTDLTAVVATDARSASVTTADGRVLETSDGGATWAAR